MVDNPKDAQAFRQVCLPASDTAVELGTVRCANMVMLGAVLAGTGLLKLETIEDVVRDTLGAKKPQLVELNINALRAGYAALNKE
jgi:2-oxoglutarate ferredoxin oxidoreductase subunit gamma